MTIFIEKTKTTFDALKDSFGWTNPMRAPRLQKIVISTGVGRIRKDKAKMKLIEDRLNKITGQKALPRPAKKSIAAFKLRDGEIVGYMVTLRGKNMQSFFDRLVNIAIPRLRDFRGINTSAIDGSGNLTIGIPEHSIFLETSNENLQDIFSFSITLVSSAQSKEEGEAFFRHLGIPFKKN